MNNTTTASIEILKLGYSFEVRLITCIFYLISSLIGVILYIFDMYVMYKHRNTFNNTFYILVGYCAVGDILYLFNIIFYIVPFSIANQFFIHDKIAIALGNGDSFFFNTIFVFLGPVALNRFMAIRGETFHVLSKVHFQRCNLPKNNVKFCIQVIC